MLPRLVNIVIPVQIAGVMNGLNISKLNIHFSRVHSRYIPTLSTRNKIIPSEISCYYYITNGIYPL